MSNYTFVRELYTHNKEKDYQSITKQAPSTHRIGFPNLGLTCYFNAAL